MKITLFPFSCDWDLEASVDGDVITINGEGIDLSGIPEGYRLPASAVENKFFMSGSGDYIERKKGELYFTLRLPITHETAEDVRSPEKPKVITAKSGKVRFPNTSGEKEPGPDIKESEE